MPLLPLWVYVACSRDNFTFFYRYSESGAILVHGINILLPGRLLLKERFYEECLGELKEMKIGESYIIRNYCCSLEIEI